MNKWRGVMFVIWFASYAVLCFINSKQSMLISRQRKLIDEQTKTMQEQTEMIQRMMHPSDVI